MEAPEGKEAPNVSFYNFSEIMAGKKEAQKAPPGQDGKAPGKAAPTSPEKETAKGTKEAAPKQKEEKVNIIPLGSHQFPASEPPGNFFLESHLRHKI